MRRIGLIVSGVVGEEFAINALRRGANDYVMKSIGPEPVIAHSGTGTAVLLGFNNTLRGLGGPNCTGNTPGANGCLYFNPFSNAYPGNPALGLTNPGFVSGNANSPALVASLFDRQPAIASVAIHMRPKVHGMYFRSPPMLRMSCASSWLCVA